ncbi:MAG: methyltransferase domain-containing protein [Verrucomicrobia bacterium]|nr:methyltransferase domain-containing protein [Verrucomicrobiota bacterium]
MNEVNYVENISQVLKVPLDEVHSYLLGKPFTDSRRGWYLMDVAQILKLLPSPPARLLDLGIGSGWTSKIFAQSGYSVVGLDIAPAMIDLAVINCRELANVDLYVCDYEAEISHGKFGCAVIYDALHHSTDEDRLLKNIYDSLEDGGVLITAEPGCGHSKTPEAVAAVRDYGTTERDMEFSLQKAVMKRAGFSQVRQFHRLSELPLEDVSTEAGSALQLQHYEALDFSTKKGGFTSLVVAIK